MASIYTLVGFASLFTMQASAQEIAGQCLMQKSSATTKRALETVAPKASNSHQSWRAKHNMLLADTGTKMDVLTKFIEQQNESGDHCSARLMESKRILDGLLKDLQSLSRQVDSHEQVLETETSNLQISELSRKAVEDTHKDAIAKCKKETEDAAQRLAQYQDELEELKQIAKPSVRADFATKVSVTTETKKAPEPVEEEEEKKEPSNEEESLVQEGGWSKDSCLAFLSFQKKHGKHDVKEDPKKRDCDAEREELQKAFTKAVIETRELLKEAQEEVEDKSCEETADAERAAKLVPLVSERERASEMIESSTQTLTSLEPVLDLVDRRVEEMSDHIYNVLTPECAEAKEVGEVLENIRELILLLDECPGRNDFKLKIPPREEEKETTEATA